MAKENYNQTGIGVHMKCKIAHGFVPFQVQNFALALVKLLFHQHIC